MNKTLLLIIIDFLFLNLIALTQWEKLEVSRPQAPVGTSVAAQPGNQPGARDQDLVAAMKESLANEQSAREALAQKLASTQTTLSEREQNINRLQTQTQQLQTTLTTTRQASEQLQQQVDEASRNADLTKEQMEELKEALAEKQAEAAHQQKAIAGLEKQQSESQAKIQDLSVAVRAAEQEKQMLRETADTFKKQAEEERQERVKVQATTVQLAQGVGELAEKTGGLTQEIRENRPINANVLFDEFLKNQVTTNFTAVRSGLFGPGTREKTTATVLVTDGDKIYALLHISDTPFALYEVPSDWQKIAVEFTRPSGEKIRAHELEFLSLDPRIVVVPIDTEQASALGVKVYPTALDPFKFPQAVLVSGTGKGYGEVGFKLDPSQPGYVRVDNSVFKRLFGDFAPSRGDLVLSKTGELLGIMVNNDYCAVVNNFLPARTIATGEQVDTARVRNVLAEMTARWRSLPLKLQ